jgi:hypothetical protein
MYPPRKPGTVGIISSDGYHNDEVFYVLVLNYFLLCEYILRPHAILYTEQLSQ